MLVTSVLRQGVSVMPLGGGAIPFVSATRDEAWMRVEREVGAFVTDTVMPYCRQNTVSVATKASRSILNSYRMYPLGHLACWTCWT